MKQVALLGATKGMGRALARKLAEDGHQLVLLGRDAGDLERSAADLKARHEGAVVFTATCDLADSSTFEPALEAATKALGDLDTVVVTAGQFGSQEDLEADPSRLEQLLTVNFTHTVLFCEAARKRLMARGGGTLCAFSSVAGERGRKPIVLYGASKAGLSAYLEGLDHRYHGDGLHVVCVKPGFVKTGMTAGLKPPPFAGEPEQVAAQVAKALEKGKPMVYTPTPWAFVMCAIRALPRFVMRRIQF